MTLRMRLAISLAAVALVLLVPLLLALHALRTAEYSTRAVANTEFAASLLIGRVRRGLENVRAAENAVLFVRDEASRARMERELETLGAMADTLAVYDLEQAAELQAGVVSVRTAAASEYDAVSAGRLADAERISTETVIPALESMQGSIRATEATLRDRAGVRIAAAAEASRGAQRSAAAALAVAALIALGIAIWLMRSIGGPVKELERGMDAVAGGNFDRRLQLSPTRRDEFGRLAASYEAMARQLADLDRLKAEFISVASHELKTPINVIIGYIELLREGIYGELAERQVEVLVSLEKQTATLTRLVNQLLDVSRFEAGGGRIEPRSLDLERFVKGLEESFNVLAVQREINFAVDRGGGLPSEVSWDEGRMNEVVGNLLSNAFKFTPRGGRVRMRVAAANSSIRMEVQDSGAGIPAEQLPHVFEKFYQADNQAASMAEGSGLGLAIAKQIVEAHKGTISVDSIRNVGTTFVITLPARVVSLRSSGKHRSTDLAKA
jgi:signal transduction histidine kinase